MRIQLILILTACIVNFGLRSAQDFNEAANETATSKEIQERRIREDFQNLFDSIINKNTNKSETYQHILKEEAAKEQQTFDAMKEALLITRYKKSLKKFNFYKNDFGENVAVKRETSDEDPNAGHETILIIGLGNPGEQYSQTRHNIGFITADELAKEYQTSFSVEKKFHCEICKTTVGSQKLIFVKPITYMNLSGKSVLSVKTYYRILQKNVIVIHDDVDLDPGRIEVKIGGKSGGHNGLKSIDQVIGNKYIRIRIGIGRPQNKQPVADYVLNNFQKSERNTVEQAVHRITSNFHLLLDNKLQIESFRNKMI